MLFVLTDFCKKLHVCQDYSSTPLVDSNAYRFFKLKSTEVKDQYPLCVLFLMIVNSYVNCTSCMELNMVWVVVVK